MAPGSKLPSHCSLLYERMDAESTVEENVQVWRGRLISTCEAVGIPAGSYSKVVSKLRELGCIEQVSRGFRGGALSTFILNRPPTADLWNVKSAPLDLTNAPTVDMLAGQLKDLQRQIGGINVIAALNNLEGRVAKLEKINRALKDTGAS